MKPKDKHYISFLLLFLLPFAAFGQHQSQGGQFEVDFVKGCAPLTINVTSTPNPPITNESVQYDYDYDPDEGFDNTSAITYTYDEPGTYTIAQIITDRELRDEITIEVFEPKPVEFSVYNCQNNAVALEINDSYYDRYKVDFGDGTGFIESNSHNYVHSYIAQGTYDITVQGLFTDANNIKCSKNVKSVTTTNTLQPTEISTVEVLDIDPDDGSIHLTYSLSPNTSYALEMLVNNSGTPQTIPISHPDSLTIDGLNTRDNTYCFTLVTRNPCDNSRLPSETICSIRLTAAAENRQNLLSWEGTANSYEILRDGQTLTAVGGVTLNYADTNVACNQEYCYQVIGNQAVNGSTAKSISGEVCVTAISDENPPAIDNVTASVDGQNIQLTWSEPQGFNVQHYIINRTEDGETYTLIDTTEDNSYTDLNLNTGGQKYCYKISYIDECGKVSKDGLIACPILLTGTQINTDEAEISWTEYAGWENPVKEYVLEVLDENGNVLENHNTALNTSVTAAFDGQTQVKLYRVKALSSDMRSLVSYSNVLRYIMPPLVFLPDAFTPNNDGLNDRFKVQGKYINQFSLLIFNRWGVLIFHTENQDTGWDGKVNGKGAPQGTYIYKYEVKDFAGQTFHKSGSFVLLR